MKRMLCCMTAVCICCCLLMSCASDAAVRPSDASDIIAPESANNDVSAGSYETVAQSDVLRLMFNKDTTHFRVENPVDGSVYDSLPQNPTNAAERSLFELRYLDSKGNAAAMNSYDDSVKKGQYRVEKLKNGVKILFTLGNIQEDLFVPKAVEKEKFENLLQQIEDRFDRAQLKSSYYLADYETLSEENRSALISEYPALKETPLYILRQSVLSLSTQREIHSLFAAAGYTEEDYAEDVKNSGELKKNAYPVFNIAVCIVLEDGRLRVRIPVSEIKEFNGAVITDISLLKGFAVPEFGEKGSFFLPDGFGSQMNFYNGKNDSQEYQVSVYGQDGAVRRDEQIYKEEQAYLPIFGRAMHKGGVLGIITGGDAMAEIHAVPGDSENHASAYAYFRLRETAKTFLSSTAKDSNDFFTVAQKKLYDGELAVDFAFFTGENSGFRNMASYYAEMLYGGGKKELSPPIYTELIGAAAKEVTVFGIKSKREEVFTSLEDSLEIGQKLLDGGVEHLVMRLTGFFTGGLKQPFAGELKLNKKVGTEEDLQKLLRWAQDNGVELYFNLDAQYVSDNRLFDGFSKNNDTSTLLTKNLGLQSPYNMATGQMDTKSSQYILNPAAVSRSVKAADKLCETLNLNGIAFQNLGLKINSDFKEGREVVRQKALQMLLEDTESVSAKRRLLTNGANAPMLPFLSHAVSLPMRSSRYDITDEMIPLLPMILEGRVCYADQAVNLTGNTASETLSSLRAGAGFYYLLTAKGGLGETEYKEYYSTEFSVWEKDILLKNKMLRETEKMTASGISGMERVGTDVYITRYKNGAALVTNDGNTEFSAAGITVPGGEYRILSDEGRE